MIRFVNATPHAIALNNGEIFEPSGILPRVSQTISEFDENGIATQSFGEIEGLPAPEAGVVFIVSALVLSACKDRTDLVAPATNHELTIRNEKGHIISVPGFVR